MLTQLRSGEIHYALITPKDLKPVEGINGVTVHENQTPRFFDISPSYGRPYFADQKVRLALLHGIDRQGIVDRVLLGHGAIVESNVAPLGEWISRDSEAGCSAPHRGGEMPGTLLEQLGWLGEAGFGCAEVYWIEMDLALIRGIRDHLHMPWGHGSAPAHGRSHEPAPGHSRE